MALTHEDNLTRIIAEAIPSLMPGDELRRWKRVDHAIDSSGFVAASAIQLLGNLIITSTLDDTLYTSTSTSVYTECVGTTITLGTGTWTLIVQADSRGGHSSGSSLDYRVTIDGTGYNEVTRPGPTSAAAPFFGMATIVGVDGGRDVAVAAEFKCATTSTANISDSRLTVIGLRTA